MDRAPLKLQSLSDDEASILLAFMDTMEAKRIEHKLAAWRVTRSQRGNCFVEVLTLEGHAFMGGGATFDEARKDLADKMIAAALDGWPGAGIA